VEVDESGIDRSVDFDDGRGAQRPREWLARPQDRGDPTASHGDTTLERASSRHRHDAALEHERRAHVVVDQHHGLLDHVFAARR
jgi:hypothetical protein